VRLARLVAGAALFALAGWWGWRAWSGRPELVGDVAAVAGDIGRLFRFLTGPSFDAEYGVRMAPLTPAQLRRARELERRTALVG
jgi:hypothetical protein